MKVINNIKDLIAWRDSINLDSSLGLVPTMGALHLGHESLIKKSTDENLNTIVSIFVNPTQFGPNEDLDKYPKSIESDLKKCENLGVNAVFLPDSKEMYKNENLTRIYAPSDMSYVLEGFTRPFHFSGVLEIVLRLFNLTRPTNAYFGQKDAQQLLIIKKMVNDFFIPINIVPCPIIRDTDGLAFSSRNVYLNSEQRKIALNIPQTIKNMESSFKSGERNANNLLKIGLDSLKDIEVEYLIACDYALKKIDIITPNQSLILLTARVGGTRLLDNLWL